MKKITILALHLGYGGVEKAISTLSNILIEKYEVEIISVYKLYDNPAFEINPNVRITYLLDRNLSPNKKEFKEAIKNKKILDIFKEGFKSIKILYLKKAKMKDAIKHITSDIIISTRIEHNELLSKYGSENSIKIAQEHTDHKNNQKYINSLVKSCNNIDYFMPVSKELTEFYKKYLDNTKTKCVYIPHSLDYIPNEISDLRSKKLVSIGRLSSEKGFDDLIDVFEIVLQQHKDYTLDIIGDGDQKDLLYSKIVDKKIQESIILHGYQNKAYINDILQESCIYINTSHEESFGLVLIEAQSFGVPCIAFDSAKGACEIISNGVNGYLISDRNKEKMAQKIIDIIEDREQRVTLGIKSRENAEKYSRKNISREWFEFLEGEIND